MDLSILHLVDSPEKNYKWKDKLNSLTGTACYFLEWSGWYNQDIYQRLLGHYRLYEAFKVDKIANTNLPSSLSYILEYRASRNIKYFLSGLTASLYYIFSFGEKYVPFQIENINRILVNDKAIILQQFLNDAENNFSIAIERGVGIITANSFLLKDDTHHLTLLNQTKIEYNQYQTISHNFNDYYHQTTNGIKGKEKGVFSKRQLLILFDLLAENKLIDRIDYSKKNKFDALATMLQALSGKSKNSIIDQLKHVNNNGVYSYKDLGELNQLLIAITNLADIFRKAGFRSIANAADKKLRELERVKNKW